MTRVLLTGASGRLGLHIVRLALSRPGDFVAASHRRVLRVAGLASDSVDLCDARAVQWLVAYYRPDCVVHAAAWTDVDGCERDPNRCALQNHQAASNVAQAAAGFGASFVFVSTDYVFDGCLGAYHEGASPNPINAYGRFKYLAERTVRQLNTRCLIIRGTFVGHAPLPRRGWVERVLRSEPSVLDDARYFSPLTTSCFARHVLDLVEEPIEHRRVQHLAGPERVTPFALGQRLARIGNADPECIAISRSAGEIRARRPRDVSLSSLCPREGPLLDDQLAELKTLHEEGLPYEFREMMV